MYQSSSSLEVCLLALKYLDKFYKLTLKSSPQNIFKSKSPGSEIRLLLPAMMLADSYLNDVPLANSGWSVITHLSNKACLSLRRAFLECIQYDLYVTPAEFNDWKITFFNYMNSASIQSIKPARTEKSISIPSNTNSLASSNSRISLSSKKAVMSIKTLVTDVPIVAGPISPPTTPVDEFPTSSQNSSGRVQPGSSGKSFKRFSPYSRQLQAM